MFGKGSAATTPKFGTGAPGAAGVKMPSFGTGKAAGAAGVAGATTAPKFGFAAKPTAAAGGVGGGITAAAPTATGVAAAGGVGTAPAKLSFAKPVAAPLAAGGIGGAGAAATTTAPGTAAAGAATTAPKFGFAAKPAASVTITPAAGAGIAAAGTTPTTAAGTAPAAAGTTPAVGTATTPKFQLGAKPATAVTGTASVGTAAGTTVAAGAAKQPVAWKPNVDIPALLKGKTLEEMINEWSSQIDADIFQFTQMAMLVGEWDKKVSTNSKKILDLKQKVDLVEAAQSELNKNLELITAQQSQLSTVLSALEASVEKWSLTVDLGPQDAERERGYALADDIDVQLNQMSFKLKEMIDRLNASQERASAKDGDHPAFQILQILDSHLNSLAWIDNTSSELGAKLAEMQSQFSRRSHASMNNDAYSWSSRYY